MSHRVINLKLVCRGDGFDQIRDSIQNRLDNCCRAVPVIDWQLLFHAELPAAEVEELARLREAFHAAEGNYENDPSDANSKALDQAQTDYEDYLTEI